MDYKWDVFFSYKREPESDAWYAQVKDKLVYWLKQELGNPDVRIFVDTEKIHTGMHWPQEIADALKRSRCIACVWSPLYFRSKWCYSEWMTFLQREQLTHRQLVLPAVYCDGNNFPRAARETQHANFSPYNYTTSVFWQTESAVKFEQVLHQFACDLAAMIANAPPYDDGFPIVEVPDDQLCPEGTIGRPADV